jgi:hypothetical protein
LALSLYGLHAFDSGKLKSVKVNAIETMFLLSIFTGLLIWNGFYSTFGWPQVLMSAILLVEICEGFMYHGKVITEINVPFALTFWVLRVTALVGSLIK